ncbi:MAG: membrane protein insertion efficiency factor YidD [Candidatus Babeliales bacterium]
MLNFLFASLLTLLRPLLGPAECKYGLSCMPFARKQLKELPLHKALWRILRRVISCAPGARTREDLMI